MIEELTNPYFLLAFVAAPVMAVAWGWTLVWLHKRSIRNGSIDR